MLEKFSRNAKGRDYIVGDIHGYFEALTLALCNLKFNIKTDRLFCAGDLVDSGPESDQALSWLKEPWFHSVSGNHDDRVANYTREAGHRWYSSGGLWHSKLSAADKEIWAAEFDKLPVAIEIESTLYGHVGIIHADCPVEDWGELGCALSRNLNDPLSLRMKKLTCRFGGSRFIDRKHPIQARNTIAGIDAVFFGHHPVSSHEEFGNIHYIDTLSTTSEFTLVQI